MSNFDGTTVSPLRVRQSSLRTQAQEKHEPKVEWVEPEKKPAGDGFLKNLGVAAALVLCAVTLRTGAIPPLDKTTDAVMTAATDNSLLDDQLGKLSFVSALFPEAVLVFGESSNAELTMPVSGGTVIHTWSEAEPYMSWRTQSTEVTSSLSGEVIGVYHGNGGERLVQILGEDGLSCVFGNLSKVDVQVGDAVRAGDLIGQMMPGEDFVLEVRQNGLSMDPALYFAR